MTTGSTTVSVVSVVSIVSLGAAFVTCFCTVGIASNSERLRYSSIRTGVAGLLYLALAVVNTCCTSAACTGSLRSLPANGPSTLSIAADGPNPKFSLPHAFNPAASLGMTTLVRSAVAVFAFCCFAFWALYACCTFLFSKTLLSACHTSSGDKFLPNTVTIGACASAAAAPTPKSKGASSSPSVAVFAVALNSTCCSASC